MSDDDDELFSRRRPRKNRQSGDSSQMAKTLLITFGILAAAGMIACCGIFGAGYYVWKKNFSQIALSQPADIQKLTAEIVDMTIPPEFVPTFGNAMLGIKTVIYQWCPTGTCPPQTDASGTMTMTSFPMQPAGHPDADVLSVTADQFTDEILKHTWLDYTKSEMEVDIRGKKCTFFVVRGEQLDFSSMMAEVDDEEDEEGVTVITVDAQGDQPANGPQPTPQRKGTGRKTVQITGSFPGKTGEVTLNVHLPEEDYQEENILGMLRSIR